MGYNDKSNFTVKIPTFIFQHLANLVISMVCEVTLILYNDKKYFKKLENKICEVLLID